MTAVGRVVCDSEGKLNEQSVLLETSRLMGNGMRVRLALQDLPSYSIFPGQVRALSVGPNRRHAAGASCRTTRRCCLARDQIIGVEGINPSGQLFNASKIFLVLPSFIPSGATQSFSNGFAQSCLVLRCRRARPSPWSGRRPTRCSSSTTAPHT